MIAASANVNQFALDFEFQLEHNLFRLYEDLCDSRYQIGPSIAFVVEQPKICEIWSATFRDRIVHHVIYNRLCDRFYPGFIRNSFACILERFFGLYASLNSFNQMVLRTKQREEDVKVFLPRTGEQILL